MILSVSPVYQKHNLSSFLS